MHTNVLKGRGDRTWCPAQVAVSQEGVSVLASPSQGATTSDPREWEGEGCGSGDTCVCVGSLGSATAGLEAGEPVPSVGSGHSWRVQMGAKQVKGWA